MHHIRLIVPAVLALALGACTENFYTTSPTSGVVMTKFDTPIVNRYVDPSFININTVTVYAPAGYTPEVEVMSDNPKAVAFTGDPIPLRFVGTENGRTTWRILVNYRIFGAGGTTVTLVLKNAGNQNESFYVNSYDGP